MSQTAYTLAPKIGVVGGLADGGDNDVLTKIASVAIPFGCFVVRDADDLKAKLPTVTGDVTTGGKHGGVALATQAMESNANSVPTFPIGKEFPMIRQGRVLVKVEEAVVQGDQAFVRFASGAGGTQLGAFRKSADTATAVALPGAYYSKGAAIGELAVLQLNLGA